MLGIAQIFGNSGPDQIRNRQDREGLELRIMHPQQFVIELNRH